MAVDVVWFLLEEGGGDVMENLQVNTFRQHDQG